MSFIDSIVDFAGGVVDYFTSSSTIGGSLARTALLGFAMNQLNQNVQTTSNSTQPSSPTGETAAVVESIIADAGVRLQVNPDPNHKIPVVYGASQLGGIITDAELTNSNQTLFVALTICERTGVKLSDGQQSVISFNSIYINDQRCVFDSDGVTLLYTTDRSGNIDNSWAGLVKIYCYNRDSTHPVYPVGYSGPDLPYAYSLMPSWNTLYTMNELVFAIVELTYSASAGLQKIPDFRFHIENNMSMPGDCLNDYMKNARYGAGLTTGEIYSA